MSEIFSGLILGVLGSYVANHVDRGGQQLARVIQDRLRRGGLPPNHDVEQACLDALRQSLEMFAEAVNRHVTRPENLVEAIANRRDEQGRLKPLLKWWHTEPGQWFDELVREIRAADLDKRFDLQVATQPGALQSAAAAVRPPADATDVAGRFHAAVLDWLERRVQRGRKPEFVDDWILSGWPLSDDTPEKKITLYQVWCLYFQDHLKRSDAVFRILTTEWLVQIDRRLAALAGHRDQVCQSYQQELGEHRELLTALHDGVSTLLDQSQQTRALVAPLLPLLLEFRAAVQDDFAGLRAALGEIGITLQRVDETTQRIDATTGRTEQAVAALSPKLDELLARFVPVEPAPAPVSTDQPRRIAFSELIASEGAARFDALIGRRLEKGWLTRGWNDPLVNIVCLVAWGGVGNSSLVIDWLNDLLGHDWPGVEAFFDWTFYSQGTKDQTAADSGVFLDQALRHFGDAATADSSAGPAAKAERLAELVARQRTLLVLDGVEPLQHPRKPGLEPGRFRDPGIQRLLQVLGQNRAFRGLCIVTTREPVVDLARLRGSTVREYLLPQLNVKDGAKLLHAAGATNAGAKSGIDGDDRELLDAARLVEGHALSLQLLGSFLKHAHGGDILRRDQIDWTRAIGTEQEGHAFHVMQAYERWFEQHGDQGRRELAALRLLGLFDRPASRGCLDALRQPAIAGLTDELAQLDEPAWRATLKRLEEHRLLKLVQRGGELVEVDAHPLVREYFARRLRHVGHVSNVPGDEHVGNVLHESEAWRAGHGRLFEYLCESVKEDQPDTLQQLQPLYQAVAHGCLAGRQQEACDNVYYRRIRRGNEHYAPNKLGAFGSELGAIASFFERPWRRVSSALSESTQAWLLNEAAFTLRALGRLTEALEPMRAGTERAVALEAWANAARGSSSLSQLGLTLGLVSAAVRDAEQSLAYAERSGDGFLRLSRRTTLADALHQSGRQSDALALFREAESLQAARQSEYPLLYSLQGFRYCDLLLADVERAAWRVTLECGDSSPLSQRGGAVFASPTSDEAKESGSAAIESGDESPHSKVRDVEQRATKTLQWVATENWLLDIALDHLTLSRARLYGALLTRQESTDERQEPNDFLPALDSPPSTLDSAVDGLRLAGDVEFIARALLTRAWQRSLCNDSSGAQADLDEAWEIAERGPMPLFVADVLMYRARLFGRRKAEGGTKKGKMSVGVAAGGFVGGAGTDRAARLPPPRRRTGRLLAAVLPRLARECSVEKPVDGVIHECRALASASSVMSTG